MNLKELVGAAVIALVVSAGVAWYAIGSIPAQQHQTPPLGAQAGPEFSNLQTFHGGFVKGGSSVSVTTTTAITGSQACNTSYVTFTLGGAATLSTPSSTDIIGKCLGNVGDWISFTVANTSGQTVTLANGDANATTLVNTSSSVSYPSASFGTIIIQRTSSASTTVFNNQYR